MAATKRKRKKNIGSGSGIAIGIAIGAGVVAAAGGLYMRMHLKKMKEDREALIASLGGASEQERPLPSIPSY